MAEPSASPMAADNEPAALAATDLANLVHEHHAAVYRYACRLAGCPVEAEDLTQQTFLTAHQRLSQLRDPASARAWLLAVVRSTFLKSVRRLRPAPAQDLDLNVDEVADRTPTVTTIDRDELHAALVQLPDEFRLVLLMFYFEELSYQEIATALELPMGTVMSRLSRAKSHLRKKLAPLVPPEMRQPARPRPLAQAGFVTASPVHAAPSLP